MNKKFSVFLPATLLLLSSAMVGLPASRAGDFTLQNTTDSKDSKDSGSYGKFERSKWTLTFDSRVGYDDNPLSLPDTQFVPVFNPNTGQVVLVERDTDKQDSVFLNFTLGATYTLATPRSRFVLGADVGVSYYFDRPGDDVDVNSGVSASFTYKLSPRMLFEASGYAAYESEPDFGASNLTGFNGVGPGVVNVAGSSNQRNGDYFYTADRFALTYRFTSRVSTVSAYNLVAFAYTDEPFSTVQDRVEHYFTQDFRYLLNPTLTLVATYRFGYIDYFSVSNDSYSNFALLGVDCAFSPRLRFSAQAGAEFRDFVDANRDLEVSPYVESVLTYSLSSKMRLSLTNRYGLEQGDLSAASTLRKTYRVGLTYDQAFTARLSGYTGFYYSTSDFDTGSALGGDFDEQTFDVAVGLRYAFSRLVSFEVGYTYTTVLSDQDTREYDRNRVFGGVRLQF
jgi:hypothetical protein